jgi:hypothetical protein
VKTPSESAVMDLTGRNGSPDTAVSENSAAISTAVQAGKASAKEKSTSKLDQGWRRIVRNFTPS